MLLSQNLKIFSELFSAFPESISNFEYFQKKLSGTGDFLLKLWTEKTGVTYMPKKPRIRTLMESQHVTGSETLLKSAR